MNRKTQVAVTALLALGGTYLLADAFDLTPGLLTTRPVEQKAAAYPAFVSQNVTFVQPSEPSAEAPIPHATDVQGLIASFIADPGMSGEASVEVVDAATGEILGSLNPTTPRIPASNQKMLTATAALSTFGPDATLPTTTVLADKTLYLVGGGDAMLAAGAGNPDAIVGHAGLGDLAEATAAKLKDEGLTSVSLAVDSSLFTGPLYHPEVEGPDTVYVMQMRPIAVNLSRDANDAFTVDPDLQALDTFAAALKQRGITANVVGRAEAPASATDIAEVRGPSVRDLVDYMLTESCNTTADILGHLIGIAQGEPGDFDGGARATKQVLTDLGYDTSRLTVSDNSGLSFLNRLDNPILIDILDDVYSCDQCALQSIASGLPVSGLNGTLAYRMNDDGVAGRIRAKTGTLIEANSLSGYVMTEKGRVLTFSILVDHIETGATTNMRSVIDNFLVSLSKL
ncbi:MAG: D-alanyl-D-alanine carboxypeptidase/D-alanyl-D-alanine-endopeptidase [Ancrocorticia sp.]